MAKFSLFGLPRHAAREVADPAAATVDAGDPDTTTHDVHGGGMPRLVIVAHEHLHDMPPAFDLRPGVSSIGVHPTSDIRLDGLAERHAEVRRDAADEYVFVHLDPGSKSTVNGREVTEMALHTGDRIMFGGWTMTFTRAESADHGRPHGGRAGGEKSPQRPQGKPRPRGTSPQGGSQPSADDPGEYY